MAQLKNAAPHVAQLRLQLKQSLCLDLDAFGLVEQSTGEFNSTYLGVMLNSAFSQLTIVQPAIYSVIKLFYCHP